METLRLLMAVKRVIYKNSFKKAANLDKIQLTEFVGKNIRFMMVAVAIIIATGINLNAAYLQNVPQTLLQPNGTVIECFASGDEFYNYLHDSNGYTIIKDTATGFYVYADEVASQLVPTNMIVGTHKPQTRGLRKGLLHSQEHIAGKRAKWLDATAPQHQKNQNRNYHQGSSPFDTINQIVILVTWNNGPAFYHSLSYYDSLYNYGPNSFKAYWLETSYNQLVVNTHLYQYQSPYTKNNVMNGTSCYGQFIKDIITNVAPNIPSSLDIDRNSDGFVDNISVILQGNPVGWGNILWPHSVGNHEFLHGYVGYGLGYHTSSCNSYFISNNANFRFGPINSKLLNTFNLNFEFGGQMSGTTPPQLLEVLCHEFFHTFGVPDFYVNTGINRVGNWSLMANSGNYVTMYERHKYGLWLDSIPTITANGTYTVRHCKQNVANNCYKIDAPDDPNYYFVIEHRKLSDEFKTGGFSFNGTENVGLLIYRVNKGRFKHGNYYGDSSGTKGEIYVYRAGGTNTTNGTISRAIYNNSYNHNGFVRNAISATTTNLTTPFLENGLDGGLDISDIIVHTGGDSVSFYVNMFPLNSKPEITSHPTDKNLTEGDNLTLSITAINATSYQWQKNGVNIASSTGHNYTKINVQLADSGDYRCIAINSFGEDTSNIAVVKVAPPVIKTKFSLVVNATNGGTVTSFPPNLTDLDSGSIVVLIASSNMGYSFMNWVEKSTNAIISSASPFVFNISKDDSIVCNFTPIEYTITYNLNGGSGIMQPTSYNIESPTITLPIPVRTGYTFKGWYDNSLLTGSTIATIPTGNTGNKEYFASWELLGSSNFTLTLYLTPSHLGTVSGAGVYSAGSYRRIQAIPNPGAYFVKWTYNGATYSYDAQTTVFLNDNKELVAHFATNITVPQYEILVEVSPSIGGSVSGGGNYDSNSTCQLIATPAANYKFVGYYLNNVLISTDTIYSFIVDSDANYEARFIRLRQTYNFAHIQEIIKSGAVSVYPNPTTDEFSVTFDILKSSHLRIELFDLANRPILEVYDGDVQAGTFTQIISTNKLSKGVYFLKISIDDGNYVVEKVIVN